MVTGAGRGIGRSVAIGFAQAGSDLILVDLSEEQLQEVALEIEAVGRKAMVVTADIQDWDGVQAAVQRAVEEMGRIDILVNNAGIGIKVPALDMPKESWDRIIAVNLSGLFACAQAVGRQMVKQGYGKIINMSSNAASVGMTGAL